jgi:hypothetical protein
MIRIPFMPSIQQIQPSSRPGATEARVYVICIRD